MTIADLVAGCRLILLAVLLSMVAAVAPSSAQQSKAVTGKGYWQETKTETCSFVICVVDFSAVPAAKQITITSVSCILKVNGSQVIAEVKLGSRNGGGTQLANYTYLTVTRNGASGNFVYYTINNSSVHILRAGEKANVTVTFATSPPGEIFSCTLGGMISA